MVKVSEGKYCVGDSNTLIFIRVSPRSGVEGPLWGRQNQVSFRGTWPRPEGKDRKSPFIPSYQALGLSFSPLENSRRFLPKLASMSPPPMRAARTRTPPPSASTLVQKGVSPVRSEDKAYSHFSTHRLGHSKGPETPPSLCSLHGPAA